MTSLRRQALPWFGAASIGVLGVALSLRTHGSIALPETTARSSATVMLVVWSLIALLAWRGLAWHPHERFGAANTVTLLRAGGTALLAGLVPLADTVLRHDGSGLAAPVSLAVLALVMLDGVDGYLARLTGLVSAFGARFDMEIDALLALVLSIVVWQSGETGIWILGLGVMRYLFVLASVWSAPLRGELFPSLRRKVLCVVQLATLCAILSPWVQPPASQWLGALAVVGLAGSFARDIHWLYTHRS